MLLGLKKYEKLNLRDNSENLGILRHLVTAFG